MSTAVGVSIDGITAIATDGLEVNGNAVMVVPDSMKCFDLGDGAAVAVCGFSRSFDLIKRIHKDVPWSAYAFADRMKQACDSDGYRPTRGFDGPVYYEQGFLFVDKHGYLYDVSGDFAVTKIGQRHPVAHGTGSEFAVGAILGALDAWDKFGVTGTHLSWFHPARLVVDAVRIAAQRDLRTGGRVALVVRGGDEDFGPHWVSACEPPDLGRPDDVNHPALMSVEHSL